jgi:hypothetical protein
MSFAIYVFLVYFMFEHIIIYLFIKKKLKSPKINTYDIKISKKKIQCKYPWIPVPTLPCNSVFVHKLPKIPKTIRAATPGAICTHPLIKKHIGSFQKFQDLIKT